MSERNKSKRAKAMRMWAIKTPPGIILIGTLASSRKAVTYNFAQNWWVYYGRGFRCVRVEVKEVGR